MLKTASNSCRFAIIGILAILQSTGCTTALQPNFYSAPVTEAERRLPLKVAIVADPVLMPNVEDPRLTVDLQPGLLNAIQAELVSIFKMIKVVRNAQDAKDADLLAFPAFNFSALIGRLSVRLVDNTSGEQVAKFEYAEQLITPPMYFTQELEALLTRFIRTMGQDIKGDRRLLALASGKGSPSTPVATTSVAASAVVARNEIDTPPNTNVMKREKAYAIAVGIENYRNQLPKADFATHDAEILARYLTKALGYPEEQVVVLLNERASKADLEKYVEHWLPSHVEPGSTLFFYFSGHGAPNPKTGEAFLVPYDGDPAFVDATGYPLKRLYEHLGKLPAKEVVVVLDSCFSGAGSRSVIAEGMRPMALSIENPILASAKTVVLAASAGSQASSTYKENGHGLMTYFFLKGLQGEADTNKDGTVGLMELFDYLKPHVERVARREFNNEQTPQLLGSPEVIKKIRLMEKADR